MPNLRISQFPYVGNTGYTSTDIIPFVNYIDPSGTTSNTTLLEHKSWILSGLSSSYLPLSGGTVSGGTSFISGLTANTISATTYQNLPLDIRVTGGTYSAGTATFTNNTGGTFNVTGFSSPSSVAYTIASGIDTYTATFPNVTSYNDGDTYIIKFLNGNTGTSTININSLGAITLYKNNGGIVIGGDILDDAEMICVYDLSNNRFKLIGTSPNSLFAYVTNDDSVTLTRGMPVYAFSGTGDRLTVKRASNNSDLTSAQTVGIVLSTSINAGQKGIIIVQGLLDGLSIFPEATYTDGDALYVGNTAGTITNVKPYAPSHLVYLGVVTTASNGSSGRMYVRIQNGYELEELHNVVATGATFGDLIVYSAVGANNLWVRTKTLTGTYTVNGNINITGTTTSNTISATTYQNLPTDIRVTGATYSNNTFTYTNNTGGTFNVNFNTVTGLTINGNLDVTGNYIVSGDTIISGTTVYSGDVTYNSNATVNGILTGAYASPYIQIGSSYTATSVNSTIEVTGGTFTLILPNANQKIGKQLYIKNDGTGIVTISGSTAGQTIDGFSQRKLAKYEELLIQSDGSSNWIILNKKAYTILFGHEWTTGSAPLDLTTYYIGNFLTQQASTVQSSSRQVIAMSSGWATDVSLMVSTAAPLGTSEDSTLTLRNVTTATNSTITTTLEHNVGAQLLNFTLSSPLQITKGDVLEIQWLTPNWGTNPAAVRHIAQVLLN